MRITCKLTLDCVLDVLLATYYFVTLVLLSQLRHLCTQPIQMFSLVGVEYLCGGMSAELPNVA